MARSGSNTGGARVSRHYWAYSERRRFVKTDVKALGSTGEVHLILGNLSIVEDSRTPGVAVKCVEIWRNTGGEGGPLDDD